MGGYQSGYSQPAQYQSASDERSSVKLHAPPGGKSSFQIGGYSDEAENMSYGGRKKVVPPPTVFQAKD